MIKFEEIELIDLLPSSLKSPETEAYSHALKAGMDLLNQKTELVYLYSNIEKQSDKVLDLLAQELRTQYYNNELPYDTKIRLIKNTLSWYRKLGTPAAVEELINTIFGSGELEEWFEYDGKPYHFKITTKEVLTEESMRKITSMIERVKNKRSVVDGFNKLQIFKKEIKTGIETVIYKTIKIGGNENARA